MSAEGSKFVVAGLPESGKTTYVAALWHSISVSPVEESLSLVAVDEGFEYLNRIARSLADGLAMDRTVLGERHECRFSAADSSGRVFQLAIPDTSGEEFRLGWATRSMGSEVVDDLTSADGLLLFVHGENVQEPIRIDQLDRAGGGTTSTTDLSPNASTGTTEPPEPKPLEFEPILAPTASILVDLLGTVVTLRPADGKKLAVAIVISAWDRVSPQNIEPSIWIETNLPLLAQYLRSNSDRLNVVFFGISALGGRLPEDRQFILSRPPEARVRVKGTGYKESDIAAPLRWLLSSR
jgi:hypothetical protein